MDVSNNFSGRDEKKQLSIQCCSEFCLKRKVGHSEALKRLQPLELVIPKACSYRWCLHFSVHRPLEDKVQHHAVTSRETSHDFDSSEAVFNRNSETRSVCNQRRFTLLPSDVKRLQVVCQRLRYISVSTCRPDCVRSEIVNASHRHAHFCTVSLGRRLELLPRAA